MEHPPVELTMGDLFRAVSRSWVSVLALTVGGGLIGVAIAFTTQRVYRAEVLLSPVATDMAGRSALSRLAEQLAPISGMTSGLGSSASSGGKDVWIATLRSRRLTENFIRERALLQELFPQRWDPVGKRWKLRDGKPQTPTMEEAFKLFNRKIRTINEDRRTGLVTLAIEWRDSHRVADWANDLVARANEMIRTRAIAESQSSLSFLHGELDKTRVVELRSVIYVLIESKINEIMLANVRKEYAFMVVDPAVAPEPVSFVRPRRAVMVLTGLVLGLLAGGAQAIVRWERKSSRLGSAA